MVGLLNFLEQYLKKKCDITFLNFSENLEWQNKHENGYNQRERTNDGWHDRNKDCNKQRNKTNSDNNVFLK